MFFQTDAHYRSSIVTFLWYMSSSKNKNKTRTSSSSVSRAIRMFSAFNVNDHENTSAFGQHNPLSSTRYQFSARTPHDQRAIPSSSSSHEIKSKSQSHLNVQKSKSVGNFKTALLPESSSRTGHAIQPESMEEIVQNIIYAFTGIEGKLLKKDVIVGGLKIDPKARQISLKHSAKALHLAEIAYYHDQVQSFTDTSSGRSPLGLVGQGLVTALRQELTEYYGMVAMLQEQLNLHRHAIENGNMNGSDSLTMLKLEVWTREPCVRLQWMAKIAEACQEKKGGALATEIHRFKHNGNSRVKSLVRELLIAACTPLQYMLGRWLMQGEINDPHSEFFIEVLPEVGTDRLWNDKYRVRESMLPCFISK